MRRIIDATRLDDWFTSTRRDAQELLPDLIRRLITATIPIDALLQLRIPVGDQIGTPGYDGQVQTVSIHPHVPMGQSVWEMGVGDPKKKADEDYTKRIRNPRGVDLEDTVFVFVTPHQWNGKDDWSAQKKSEGMWKDIKVLDVSDLECWLD